MSDDAGREQRAAAERERIGRFSAPDAVGLGVRGLAMGACDVVPGVSGGTIAFITGIYERFINALRSLTLMPLVRLARGDVKGAWRSLALMHWGTLLPIIVGVASATVLFSKFILAAMESHPGWTYAAFFGLIAASAWVPVSRMHTKKPQHLVGGSIAAVLAFLVVGLTPSGPSLEVTLEEQGAQAAIYLGKIRGEVGADGMPPEVARVRDALGDRDLPLILFDPDEVVSDAPEGWTLIRSEEELAAYKADRPPLIVVEERSTNLLWAGVCGMIAISAMILPGLSGSFLLLFLGMYHTVFSALHRLLGWVQVELLGGEADVITLLSQRSILDDFLLLLVFQVGLVIGIVTFSRVVGWVFERAHDMTMAALTGLMLGALRLPGMEILSDPMRAEGAGYWWPVVGFALAGAVAVTVLNLVDSRQRKKNPALDEAREAQGSA
jgi:putative membrane protein